MSSNNQMTRKGSRGSQKIMRATGVDNSSYGGTGAKNINSASDMEDTGLNRSISGGGKVPSY